MSALLEVSGISKSFDGFKAINNLSFSINAAELRAVIGPNGAGKTTLLSALIGLLPSTYGTSLVRLPLPMVAAVAMDEPDLGSPAAASVSPAPSSASACSSGSPR